MPLQSWMRWLLLAGEFLPFFGRECDEEVWLTIYSILCSEYAIKRIDEPFVLPTDNLDEWAL
jgi:hypothetical protein